MRKHETETRIVCDDSQGCQLVCNIHDTLSPTFKTSLCQRVSLVKPSEHLNLTGKLANTLCGLFAGRYLFLATVFTQHNCYVLFATL